MVLNGEELSKKLPEVLAGRLDLPVKELWELLYYINCFIHNPDGKEDQKYAKDGMALFKMLLHKADQDDDDEMDIVLEALYEILGRYAEPFAVLDQLEEEGISFTETRYYKGKLTTIRDFLLEERFSVSLVDKMAQMGVDLNQAFVKGRTPALLLAYRGSGYEYSNIRRKNEMDEAYADVVERYFSVESMEALDMEGRSAAHWAVRRYKYEMFTAMIKKGVNINLTEDQPSVAGNTLLHTACEYGFQDMVHFLMDAGADDTLKNVNEETAAHIAVSKKISFKKISVTVRAEMVEALRNIDIPGKNGMTPLMIAQDYDLHAANVLTPVFIKKGADVNQVNHSGDTALLLHMRWRCDKSVIKAMVEAGYHINTRNKLGDTVLNYAMKNRSSEMVRYLLKKGADYTIANEKQVTPLEIAVEQGMDEVLPFMGL